MNLKRSIADIIADLSKPLPEDCLEQRKQGGTTLHYVAWHKAVNLLDTYAPGWSSEVTKMTFSDTRIFLVCRISIPCLEGVVHREATGTEELDSSSYGDPSSNAESMAFRRAAAKFGLALYLYDKELRESLLPPKAAAPASTGKPERKGSLFKRS